MTQDEIYLAAALALRRAECEYRAAETKLIHARRAVEVAKVGSNYGTMLHAIR